MAEGFTWACKEVLFRHYCTSLKCAQRQSHLATDRRRKQLGTAAVKSDGAFGAAAKRPDWRGPFNRRVHWIMQEYGKLGAL